METTECKHRTTVTSLLHGIELEECGICHQHVTKHVDKLTKPTVTKLGRIGDRIVLPSPDYRLQLSFQDQADLAAAQQRAKIPAAAQQNVIEAPGRPGKEDPKARRQWFRDNKKEMIDDLLSLGKDAFLKKWKVTPKLISPLKRDKYYKQKAAQAPSAAARVPLKEPGDKLPALPPWNDNWAPEVQVRWLSVYETLITFKED